MNRRIDNQMASDQKLKNGSHTLFLLTGMLVLTSLTGWLFAGAVGMVAVLVIAITGILVTPRLSTPLVRRWLGAFPLTYRQVPSLYATLEELMQRAGLPHIPTVMVLPTHQPSALTTGSRDDAVIAVSEGLLRTLDPRELTAVLAHEISHLKNNDLWMMNVSATFNRMTSILATAGQMLLLLNFPLMLIAGQHISWGAIVILLLAPTMAMLLQLALSRTREFDADLGAAALTQDPRALASALMKMERYRRGWMGRLGWLGRPNPYEAIWNTHPPTRDRVRRLMTVSPKVPAVRSRPCPRGATAAGWYWHPIGVIQSSGC